MYDYHEDGMDVWVQRSLFDESDIKDSPPVSLAPATDAPGRRRSLRVDRSRVTRDPDVAASYSRHATEANDFRLGLARALAALSPEERAALRAPLGSRESRSAA